MDDLKKCLEAGRGSEGCDPDHGGRTAFTITDGALDKLQFGTTSGTKGGSWQLFDKQEKDWRKKEECIENAHQNKAGIDKDSLLRLERSLTKATEMKCPCALGAPVLACYKPHTKTPLHCRNLVRDYVRCVQKYQKKVALKVNEQSKK